MRQNLSFPLRIQPRQGKVDIPESDALPLDSIAPGLIGLRIAFVNGFRITHLDGSWTLIDAAIPISASHIKAERKRTSPYLPTQSSSRTVTSIM